MMYGHYIEQVADNLVWQLSGRWRSNKWIIHRGALTKILIICIQRSLLNYIKTP